MATNIEQIFRSFVVNKFKEIQEEGKLTSDNSENSQNGELTAQKEESTSESTTVCIESEGAAPTCQEETMKTENLELAKPVTKAVEADNASKELKSADLTSDDEVKKESSKKKSKKHKKHKSKKKKKKKKKEKHEKRSKSKSISSVEDQENVGLETKPVWKPAFSSPPKEQGISDALSKAENTNTDVLSSVNTQETVSSVMEGEPKGLDVDSGFFGPKCPIELSKNVSSNYLFDAQKSPEQCETSALPTQLNNESSGPIEKPSEIAKTQQSELSLPNSLQEKSPVLNSSLDVNSEKDSLNPNNSCESLSRSMSNSNCEKFQISNEKSRSNSRHRSRSGSLRKVPKSLETSTKSPKSRQRSNSISRDQRKQSRSSSVGQRRRSSSRSPGRRRRSRSRTERYSKTPIRIWWSKSIRNRRRSVSVVKKRGSRTRSPARRQKSRSRSTERRQRSRTRSRSTNNKRGRSKSAKRRHSKSVSVSRIRRSRSYSGSRKRKSRSGSVSRRPRSGSRLAARKRRSRSGSAARKRRSRSTSAVRRQKSRTVSPARRRKSRSATPARRRSRSGSPIRRRRSRSASFTRRRKSRSTSPSKRRKSKSGSPARRRRSRTASPARRRRSRTVSPARRRRSRSASPTRRRRSRSVSPARRRRSRSSSPPRRRRSRSISPARRRRSRSASPARRRRSRSASPARRRRSRSASPARRRRSRSPSPSKRRRSSSVSRRRKSVERQYRRISPVKRQRSRSGSGARRQSMRSTSVSRKKSISPSKNRKSPQSIAENMSRSRSGSIILKQKSGSVERKCKSRSRSSSKVKNSDLAPLNSASSTITQTNSSSSSEIINDERKLSEMTSESLNNTSYLEKTDSSENLKESSIVNEEIGSCVLPSVTNQEMLDSSFKASVSNLSCTRVESNALQNDSDTSEKIMLTSTDILVEPSVHAEPTSLECLETNYEKLQNSSGDAESLNDKVFQSSQKVSTLLVEEPCDIPKPDLLSTVSLGMASTSSESEKACPTTHKDSFDMFEPPTCDQYSIDNKLKIPNEVLHSDYTSSETEGNLSYDNSVSNQNSCKTDLNISPVETVQCSDWKYFESNSFNMSDDGFKKPDSIDSPSASTVSCIEAPPEHALTQDTSASHVDKLKTELNLAHSSLHHSALTSHDVSDAVVKPNLFIATNNASLESTLNNQFETPIRTLKEPLSESYSQVDANFNCSLQHGDASTPSVGLPHLETVVLLNSTEQSHATILGEQSYTILSEKTCSEQTNLDIACGNTTESFPNDFESHKLVNQNVTKTDEADSTEREHPSEAAMHQVSNTYLEVESTQAEKCISQSCEEIRRPSPKHRTESFDMFSNSQDQTNVNSRSSDLQVCISVDENKSSSSELEHVELGGLYQSLYSSSENLEGMPAMTSTDDSGKDIFGKSQNMERSHLKDVDMQFKNDHSKVDSLSARGDDEATKIAVGSQEYVFDKGKCNSRVEAEQKSEPIVPGSPICPDMFMGLSPRKKLSKAPVEQIDADIGLLGNSNEQNLDNTVKSTTANTTNDGKDLGPTMYLSIDSKDDNQSLAEKQFGLEIEADHLSHEKTGSPSTVLVADTFSIKQNATSKMDFKPVTEVESNSESLSKLYKNVNLDVDVESKTKNHGQVEYASNKESMNVCYKTPEAPKIFTPVVHEMQKPPPVMPLQFKFSKTFKTLATSQLCNTSDESSDKEMSKVSSLSLSTKASTSAHVESTKNSGKVPQKVLLQKLDTPMLPEALQPESSSDVGSDGKDVLQQDVIQTDDSQSNAAVKLAFPHISNPSSKLGLKQRQYRSRSVAQDSRSPSLDRRQASRSRSKSTARKRRSRSKSKKRSQSSSRKKSSHSKSSKNKRSRSKSRGRKRRSQSKSKSKKKHSPSKSSGKRKRSRSKSSEKVRSAGKRDRSRSKSKTRRKELQTKSPNSNRRSRSKSAVRKSSGSKNLDVRKASRSKSGSSRSRSRSLSVSRRHLLHSKVSLYRKPSRSSSKSTSPRKRSLSRNKGRSPSRSPARRHRSRSRSRARRHRSRSRGRWRRSLSSSRKHSRSSSRTSGPLSAKKRRSVSKSPIRGHRSRSQAKQKDKSPVTKRKSISPLPQKKTIQSKAAAFKHSIGLKSLIQKQLSQAKSQGSGGKLSKEQIPLATIAARAQLPAANFSTRAPVPTPSIGQVSVPNLAEVPLPSENGNGQIPVSNVPPEQQMPITTLAPEVSLSVPDLTTSTPWHVPEMATGAQWPVPDIAAGAQWTMSDLTAGAQWPMSDLGAGSHWPMHDLSVGTQWSVPDLAAGTPWAVPDVATGAQWTVPDLTASTQWTVPDLTAGSQWAMTNLAPGTQWSVPDLAAAAQWTVPDLTSGTHIHSADLAPEAQVPGSDLVSEAQVPGSDLVTEAQVPGSDLTAEAQVPRSDLVSEAQVPVPDHIPESCDNFVSDGHNLMPDVTAEALVPVASGTLVPDVAAGIPLPDVTAATPIPVPDVAATANLPVPDVATTAHSFISDYASYSTVHESVLDNSAEPCAYLDMTSAAGEHLLTAQLQSEAPNRTEHLIVPESLSSTDHGLHSELPLTHATVPEMPTTLSKDQISVSFECQPTTEPSSVSNSPSFDHCLRSETSSFIESTPDQVGSGMSIHYESHTDSDCQLLPASDTDGILVNNLHVDSNPSLLQESCPSPMQSYISPNHATLVDPYQSPDDNLLIEPYSSPDRPNLVTEFSDSVCQLLTEPDAVSDCFGLAASSVSSENSSIVKDFSHDHSHQELTEHNVNQDLHHQEPSTTLPCPEPTDCFDKPHYTEQVKTNVSPSCDISGDQNAEPDVPQLVEPYGSPEHPQLVEPYASPEQLQLVEPYASPECPQLVEPYASPEHPLLVEPYGSPDSQELHESEAGQEFPQSFATPGSPQAFQSSTSLQCPQLDQLYDGPDRLQRDQTFSNVEQTSLVKLNSSPKSLNSPESPHMIQTHADLQCLDQPYIHLEHKLDETSADQKPICLKHFINSEHQHLVQAYTTTEDHQVVQSSSSSDSSQLVKLYDSPEHPQLVQPYESPEHSQLVESHGNAEQPQPGDSPEHTQLALPFDCMQGSQLIQPYVTTECPQPDPPCTNSELEKPHVRPEHLQFDKSNTSPEQVQTQQPYESPKNIELVQSYTISENDLLVQNVDGDGVSQLAPLNKSPEHLLLVQPCVNTDHPQQEEIYAIPEPLQFEPNSSLVHPQLVESYSSSYNNLSDKPSSGPDLSLNLESPRHDIEDNCKLTQSHLSVSTFDTPLPDAKKSENLLEGSCSNVLQKQNSPKFTQPILEECCNNSSEICSEEFHNATHNSLLLNTTESPVHLFSKQDYMESEQYLSGDSDSTLLDRSASTCHQLESDHASDFHQPPLEKTSSSNEQLELEFEYVKGDKHLEKKLSPVVDHAISDQPQSLSEHTNSEQYISSPASCLNKDNVSTDQVSDYLMKASSHSLDLENSSNTTQLLKDKYSLDSLEQPSMPLVDGAPSNAEVSLVDNVFGDSVVPSVEQSIRLTENKNLSTAEHHLLDENTEIIECDLPNKLTAPTEELSAKVYSTTDNLPQNEPLEGYSYKFSENNHSNFMSVNETPSRDCSEQSGVDTDSSKNRQIVSNSEIENVLELDVAKVENTLFSSEEVCNKPLAVVLSEETKELPTNFSLQTQEKVDSFMPVEASTLSDETCVDEVSGDNIQIDNECKITPPDLLPFDSEQPPHMCLNSESSSEPVLFISQPPPELLPYDSEQPANPFLNISDYSSEQDSSVFHTPPELLPYDSDQTTMLVSQPESCEEKQTFCEMANSSEKSSASESPSLVSPSCVGTQTTEVPSVTVTDASIISTSELLCVKNETSASLTVMHDLDLNSSEMLVEQPAAPFSDVEFEKKPPSSQSLRGDTESMLEHQMLSEVTTLGQSEHSIDSQEIADNSVKSAPSVSIESIEQTSLILDTYSTSVVPSCSDKCEVDKEEKLMASQSHVATSASIKRSRSKSVSKTEICLSLSTSTKHVSPVQSVGRTARSRSQSKDRRKSRSKSITRKKRSLSKSVTHTKKSRSKSLVKTRKSRSKSATRRKRSRSVSGTRLRKSRSRSLSRKRHSRSVSRKRSSRSPSAVRRRRSRSVRRKRSRSKSVDHKRSHSHSTARRRRSRSLSIARRRHSSRSRSPVRRKRSRSSSIHRRKRSRSSSVARRRRSRSLSVTRRRRSRSSSVSRRRRSPLQTVTRRRRSPSLVRRRRSRSQSLPHRRRSRSASHRRRSRSPSASRRRRSPSAPHRRHSPSLPRRKRSSSAARKRRSHSTSVTRKRHSRSSSASRKRRSRSSSISHKRHSQTPLLACKRRSESKSPSPKSPKSKPRAQSKSERSRSRSQSNITHKRKTLSRSSSRDKSKSNEKRRKRSNSKDHYSTKQRRKSRTPPRRKKSRSPARRASPCRSPVRRRRSRSPVRRKSFSRSPVRRKRSRSRDQTMDSVRSPKRLTDLDKAQLLEIAKANAAAMCAKAGMPLPPSLKPVLTPSAPVDEKVTHRTYGVTIQELTEKCKLIAQSKEDDEVVNKPHDSDEEEDDKPFYNHPFKVSEHKPISFSLLNPSMKPAPKNQVTLTKEFPVSSGSQHRKKESDKVYGEWVPVDKKTGETIKESKDDVFTNTGPSQF